MIYEKNSKKYIKYGHAIDRMNKIKGKYMEKIDDYPDLLDGYLEDIEFKCN